MRIFKNTLPLLISSGAIVAVMSTSACATKKHVRNTVAPIEARVGEQEKKTAEQAAEIADLERNLSQTTEAAMGADKKAEQAAQSAASANQAAVQADQRAKEAGTVAQRGLSRADEVDQNLQTTVRNLDNYREVSAETVLFGFDKSQLSPEARQQLDELAKELGDKRQYVIEVQGYTDRTGSPEYNLRLSQRRADAVVRYLATEHQIPLRRIHVLGVGQVPKQEGPSTREARKLARKVDVTIYQLELTASGNQPASSSDRAQQSPR